MLYLKGFQKPFTNSLVWHMCVCELSCGVPLSFLLGLVETSALIWTAGVLVQGYLPASSRCHSLHLPDNSTTHQPLSTSEVALARSLPPPLERTHRKENGAVFLVLSSFWLPPPVTTWSGAPESRALLETSPLKHTDEHRGTISSFFFKYNSCLVHVVICSLGGGQELSCIIIV